MSGKRRTARDAEDQEATLRGRSFAEEQYAAAEREQARENERLAQPTPDEAAAFVSEAEIEEVEDESSPRDEGDER